MYRKHFGLTRHPFSKELPPDELFVSAAGRELEVRARPPPRAAGHRARHR